jgi:small subunit ribosomal protein S15
VSLEQTKTIVKNHQRHKTDVGSPEVQIGIFTARIKHLTQHLKTHPKDLHTQRGLQMLVNKRRSALDYLKRSQNTIYLSILKKLGLRR